MPAVSCLVRTVQDGVSVSDVDSALASTLKIPLEGAVSEGVTVIFMY